MTDEEIQKIVTQLGPLIGDVAKAEGLSTPQEIADWLERLLIANGYRCINGVWQTPAH